MLGINNLGVDYPPLNQIPQPFNFKSQAEKDIIVKMLEHSKEQLEEYMKQKQAQKAYEELKENSNQTVE